MSLITATQQAQQHIDEHILVVPRTKLFANNEWQGFKASLCDEYIALIEKHKEFHPRSIMETDPRYKQIIPYAVFTHQGRYFLMQRKAKASESRLQGKYTLGIGGHMRQEDLQSGSTLFDWTRREFYEEISYSGSLSMQPLGMLNDDSNAVGQVHIGLVLLLHGDSDAISVKEELESGRLVSLEECHAHYDRLESWSQLILSAL